MKERATSMGADQIFVNGIVVTMDDLHRETEALAVSGGRIVAVGPSARITEEYGEDAELIDLGGRAVFPGLVDAHTHLEMLAYSLELSVDCRSPRLSSIEEIVQELKTATGELPEGTWVLGQGNHFQDAALVEGRYPDRFDLDRASITHPLVYRSSFHFNVFNTCALDLLGITPETPDAPGGRIEHDAQTGELTGRTYDMYIELGAPEATVAELQDGIAGVAEKYLAVGVTTVGDIPLLPNGLEALFQASRAGRLRLRVVAYPKLPTVASLAESTTGVLAAKFGDLDGERLSLGGLKLFLDGGLTSAAASLYEPYEGDPDNCGELAYDVAELHRTVTELAAAGHQVLVHATGDRALDMTLDALGAIPAEHRRESAPHRVEHGGNVFVTDERIERFHETGAMPVPQPAFILTTAEGYRRLLGERRSNPLMPLRRLLDAGLRVPGNSDAIGIRKDQYSPFLGMFAAVARESSTGTPINPDQAITIAEAFRIYTRNAALALGKEAEIGSLEPGKLADFVVFESDPRLLAPADLLTLQVSQTWLNGELVHEA